MAPIALMGSSPAQVVRASARGDHAAPPAPAPPPRRPAATPAHQDPRPLPRRALLAGAAALLCARGAAPAAAAGAAGAAGGGGAYKAPDIRPELAPDQSAYDAADPRLRAAAALLQDALAAPTVAEEERLWTRLIDEYGRDDAPWAADVVGRALGNRGNARARQGRLLEALADYDAAIARCPWAVDPVLNRGAAYEALGRWGDALADYRAVLAVDPGDPAALNNYGNASAGAGDWVAAEEYFGRAAAAAPRFAGAAVNHAAALYQLGGDKREAGAVRELRALVRRFPDFADARAALAAALWAAGLQDQAEGEWARVDDARYASPAWLAGGRRWPPRLVAAAAALLAVRDVRPAPA